MNFKYADLDFVVIDSNHEEALSELDSEKIYLLDDRVFNQKNSLSRKEFSIRCLRASYYYNYLNEEVYDQFEVFHNKTRIRLSQPLVVEFKKNTTIVTLFRTLPFHSRALIGWSLQGDVLSNAARLSAPIEILEAKFSRIEACDN
jgi:hypothetical protein